MTLCLIRHSYARGRFGGVLGLCGVLAIVAGLSLPAASMPGIQGSEGEFLAWGAGGRALGLGKAYVALATDATASYWNPAGLAAVNRAEATALHAALWEGASYDYLGLAFPSTPLGPIGMFVNMLSVGGVERRNDENSLLPGGFGASKAAVGMATAYALTPDLSLGLSVKYIGRWIDTHQSGFVSGDFGVRYTPSFAPWWTLAAVAQHVASTRWGPTEDVLPRVIRAGMALTPLVAGFGLVTAEVEVRPDSSALMIWRVGVESVSFGPLTARLGMDTWELAAGVGFIPGDAMPDLRLDYGVAKHEDLGLSHRVSVAWAWGTEMTTVRALSAQKAYERALAVLEHAHWPYAFRDVEESVIQARALLEEVLRHDPRNDAAQRLLNRLTSR